MASLVYTQSELLKHDVVLIEQLHVRVSKPVDPAASCLQCICILRPTAQNIHDLCCELNCPHFNTYYIFFTNVVKRESLQQIAFADHSNKVFVVHEIFMDVLALNRRLFSLGLNSSIKAIERNPNHPKMQRIIDGLFSILCAFKLKASIRYDARSRLCKDIGDTLSRQISTNSDLFQTTSSPAMLLLLDRRTDPISPLLHTWSYQALIHEILGMDNNVVVRKTNTYVLDERTDEFFTANLFSNYGEIGDALNALTSGVKAQHMNVSDIQDIEGLKKFIHSYPIYQEKQALAAKHASILAEISDAVKRENLLEIAPLEQKIAVESAQQAHCAAVMAAIRNPEVADQNAIRLSLLYALHYEPANVDELKAALGSRRAELPAVVDAFLDFTGHSFARGSAAFSPKNLFSKAKGLIGLDENKFELYTPGLASVLQKVERRQLDVDAFPFAREIQGEPKKVIVFVVGGVTYDEARIAAQCGSVDLILGGTTVHNSKSYTENEVMEM